MLIILVACHSILISCAKMQNHSTGKNKLGIYFLHKQKVFLEKKISVKKKLSSIDIHSLQHNTIFLFRFKAIKLLIAYYFFQEFSFSTSNRCNVISPPVFSLGLFPARPFPRRCFPRQVFFPLVCSPSVNSPVFLFKQETRQNQIKQSQTKLKRNLTVFDLTQPNLT